MVELSAGGKLAGKKMGTTALLDSLEGAQLDDKHILVGGE